MSKQAKFSKQEKNDMLKNALLTGLTFFLPVLLAAGCYHGVACWGPTFAPFDNSIGRIGILTPDMSIYNVSAGGVYEYRYDWSRQGSQNLVNSICSVLQTRSMEGRHITDSLCSNEFAPLKSLLRLHASTIQNNLYSSKCFTNQLRDFTYSISPQDSLCDEFGVDGFMYVYGFKENFSDEREKILRKQAKAKTARSVAWGTIGALLTGVAGFSVYSAPSERAFLGCIIVKRNGKIKYYNHTINTDNLDLSRESDASVLISSVLQRLSVSEVK